jgi:hypothetical protein
MMLQAAVSLLNIGARRLGGGEAAGGTRGPEDAQDAEGAGDATTRDLEQVRDAIDGVRALLDILERRMPETLRPLRDALAQLQLAYAREVQADSTEPHRGEGEAPERSGEAAPAGQAGGGAGEKPQPASEQGSRETDEERRRPGPAESSGRLWVPGR